MYNRLKSVLLIGAGVAVTAVGAIGATHYNGLTAEELRKPGVQQYTRSWNEFMTAIDEFNSVPETRNLSYVYIPQSQRSDYSVSAAHTRIEQASQKLTSARQTENRLSKDPAVRPYLLQGKKALATSLLGLSGLLILGLGIKNLFR